MPIHRLALVVGFAVFASIALTSRARHHAFVQASPPAHDSGAVGGCAALAVGGLGLLSRLRRQ